VVSTGEIIVSNPVGETRDVDRGSTEATTTIMLSNAVPNPATRTTAISFALAQFEPRVDLVVSDMRGTELLRLIDGVAYPAGEQTVTLDCSPLPAGTYYYTLRTATQSQTRRMVIVR
jgi:hypothetical protein